MLLLLHYFPIKVAITDFTANKNCSHITLCICKSVCIHMHNAVTFANLNVVIDLL